MKKRIENLLLALLFLIVLVSEAFLTKDKQCLDDLFILHNTKENMSGPIHESDVEQYMTHLNNELGIPEQKLKYITSTLTQYPNLGKNIESIQEEAVIEDVEFLFDVLKYSYAGYSYFATEDVWKDLENRIISSIKMHDTTMNRDELIQMLCTNLNFIQDSHFKICGYSPIVRSHFYYNDTIEIEKDSRGYYVKDNRQKWYIQSIENNENVEYYIKPSLNAEGKLCYYLGLLDTQSHTHLNVVFQSNSKEYKTTIKVSRSESQSNKNEKAYTYKMANNIPVITMGRMYNKNAEDHSVEEFVESAKKISNQELAILDLRGNTGGQSWGANVWFQNFTGDPQIPQFSTLKLWSKINTYGLWQAYQTAKENSLFPPEELLEIKAELSVVNPTENCWIFTEGKEEKKQNTTKLIVLLDGNTASATENLVLYLNTLENVVFIGTNTLGCFFSNANMKCILPNSEIEISYGDQLTFTNNCIEGTGFQPDIWIGGQDALERTLAFLEKNGEYRVNE